MNNNRILSAKRIFRRSFAFAMLLLLCVSMGFAQQATLSTSHVSLSADTLPLNSSDTMFVTVKNLDSIQYTGFWSINFSTLADTAIVPACYVPSITLAPNGADSATNNCAFTFLFDSTHFHPGYNIIVVWSSGNARDAADSITIPVFLLDSTGQAVHEHKKDSDLKIYPSITSDLINIESPGNIFPLKIFIADVSGRILRVISPAPDSKNRIKINTSDLTAGIYFIDMLMPDKTRVVSKFVKEE